MRCLTYHRVSTNDQDPRLARVLASNGVRLAGSVCKTVVFLENAHEPALAFSANGGRERMHALCDGEFSGSTPAGTRSILTIPCI